MASIMDSGGQQSNRTSKKFCIGYLNVRTLNTGFDEFVHYLNKYRLDVLGLSETWLSSNYGNDAFSVTGYSFVRKNRHGRGGGVALYIKKKHLSYEIAHLDIATNLCEFIAVQLTIKQRIFYFFIYIGLLRQILKILLTFWKTC